MNDDTTATSDDAARTPRKRKAVGPERQTYFGTGDVDRVMAILLALVSEVAAIRERLDTHERLGASGALATDDRVDAYQPDDAVDQVREAWRDACIRRLFRAGTEDVEGLRDPAPPVQDPPA